MPYDLIQAYQNGRPQKITEIVKLDILLSQTTKIHAFSLWPIVTTLFPPRHKKWELHSKCWNVCALTGIIDS